MTQKNIFCKKCNEKIKKTDAVCLNCGNIIKKIKKFDDLTLKNKKIKRKNTSWFKHILSFVLLLFTIFFAYLYLYNFAIFLNISDMLFSHKQYKLCQKTLNTYQKISLNKDLYPIKAKSLHLKLEMQKDNLKQSQNLNNIEIQYLDNSYNNPSQQISVKLNISNKSPFIFYFSLKDFYLSTSRRNYLSDQTETKKLTVKPWENITITLLVNHFVFQEKEFFGKIIFNNTNKYAKFNSSFVINKNYN